MFSILTTDSTPISRNQLMDNLASDGIETRTFFYPIPTQPTYSNLTKTHNFLLNISAISLSSSSQLETVSSTSVSFILVLMWLKLKSLVKYQSSKILIQFLFHEFLLIDNDDVEEP